MMQPLVLVSSRPEFGTVSLVNFICKAWHLQRMKVNTFLSFLQNICPRAKAQCYTDTSFFLAGDGGWVVNFNISLTLYFHFVIKFRLQLSICGLHFSCPLNLKMRPTRLSDTSKCNCCDFCKASQNVISICNSSQPYIYLKGYTNKCNNCSLHLQNLLHEISIYI